MAVKPDKTSTTMAPSGASLSFAEGNHNLSKQDRRMLEQDIWQSIQQALADRGDFEQNLSDWNDLYEMRTAETDTPWPNASNVFIPLIPAQVDTAVAYITGKVFVPRFYIVTGNTDDAATTAPDVERFYNAELVRQRGESTWYDKYLTWLHLSMRDGTAIMEVIWKKTVRNRTLISYQPTTDETGVPIIDLSTGKPVMEKHVDNVLVTEVDGVELNPVLIRDFLVFPSISMSINEAMGCARALWLDESHLSAMTKTADNQDGVLWADEVEYALSYVPTGQNDFSSDQQGSYDKTAGDQINAGNTAGSQTSRFFANRGPIKVWRVHSNQYDMNGDGIPEENIFFIHEISMRLLGWAPYGYITSGRPFFAFSPYPRPDRLIGYSLCERLSPIQAEVNAMYNSRNNLVDLMLSPPLLYTEGDELDDKEQLWGPAVRWPVTNVQTSVRFMEFPTVPLASFQNEALLNSYADKLTGISAPEMGAQGPGRRSASEIRVREQATNTRNDSVALRLRVVCRAILAFIHTLNLQYLPDNLDNSGMQDPQIKYRLPKEILAKDYQLDVVGSSDPVNADMRRQENISLFEMLVNVPWIGQDMVKSYNAVRMVLESFNRSDVTALIGTEQDAQQRQQAMQQQQQQQKQMQQQAEQVKMAAQVSSIQRQQSGGNNAAPQNNPGARGPAPGITR